jgi:hypothetical protein
MRNAYDSCFDDVDFDMLAIDGTSLIPLCRLFDAVFFSIIFCFFICIRQLRKKVVNKNKLNRSDVEVDEDRSSEEEEN